MKGIFLLLVRPRIIKSFEILTKIYQQNDKTAENQSIFQRFIDVLEIALQFIIGAYAFALLVVLIGPIILYFFTNIDGYLLITLIPGLSLDSWHRLVHSIFQGIIAIECAAIQGYFDVLFVIQVSHIVLMGEILRKKVRAISRRLGVKQQKRRMEIAMNLRNVINLHNEMLE